MKALQSFRDLMSEKNLRAAPRFTEVNATRVVLFDFVAAKEYPEQISVRAGELVFVFEAYPDGWCEVKNHAGKIGVIPTAYHGEYTPPAQQNHKLELQQDEVLKIAPSTRGQQLKRQASGLGRMAKDKLVERACVALWSAKAAIQFVIVDCAVPLCARAYRIASKNENKSTTVSFVARNFFHSVSQLLIPMLSDAELAAFSMRLQEDAAKIKAETVHRQQKSAVDRKELPRAMSSSGSWRPVAQE